MKAAGFSFVTKKPEVDEVFPENLPVDEVARYLAALKADYFRPKLEDQIVVTADTVVILDNRILNKPTDRDDAVDMLSRLAGRTHKVMTGVSIMSRDKAESFDETTFVTFEPLSRSRIEAYVDTFQPYDKAGAYGAQETLPEGMNPCSEEERNFLKTIGNASLLQDSTTSADDRVVLIQSVRGSFFNVMGLPIVKVYQHLTRW